ncbi:sensor histidine kinase [Yinghuangia aomiensis]
MDGAVRLARERKATRSLPQRRPAHPIPRRPPAPRPRRDGDPATGPSTSSATSSPSTTSRPGCAAYEENLVILSGHQPGRRWSKPVRVVDIVRSAVGEVEDYERIDVHMSSELLLQGAAVGAVIHLLAELLENATTFSPPRTPVEARGMPVAKGLVVEIEDRGLGMAEDDYAALNTELEQPRAFDMVALAEDVRLGLFVVARLAERHGIGATLRASPYGGTLAIVFLPEELIVRPGEEGAGDGRSSDAAAGKTPRTRPRPPRTQRPPRRPRPPRKNRSRSRCRSRPPWAASRRPDAGSRDGRRGSGKDAGRGRRSRGCGLAARQGPAPPLVVARTRGDGGGRHGIRTGTTPGRTPPQRPRRRPEKPRRGRPPSGMRP